jgi:beta-galactosidase
LVTAITENNYGKGLATYIGCMLSDSLNEKILPDAVKKAGLWGAAQGLHYPVITKEGVNGLGKTIHYLFNYSAQPVTVKYSFGGDRELLGGKVVGKNGSMVLEGWAVGIVEEERR